MSGDVKPNSQFQKFSMLISNKITFSNLKMSNF